LSASYPAVPRSGKSIPEISRDELSALQLRRLQRTLQQVYDKVPFYRERFNAAGVCVGDFARLEQLGRLPFTTKKDLWEHYPLRMLAVEPAKVARVHASSGTKGRLTMVGYTLADLDDWAELCARGLRAAGVQPGMRVHNAYGYGLFTGGLGFHAAIERIPATVIPASGGNVARQLQLLEDLQPEVLCCTPSFALTLADARERSGRTKPMGLRIGMFGAEPWSESMREQIERRLGLLAIDNYGLSEVGGPGVACECVEARSGLHIWEDFFLPEIIDPQSGEVLPPGSEGELVLTTLQKEAVPLVRYRTGDITALETSGCACGRIFVRMRRVQGRRDDMLIIRGVNFYPSELETVVLRFTEVLPFYEVIVDRPKHLDEVTVRVECRAEYLENADRGAELSRRIQAAIAECGGLRVEVALLGVGQLARSEGKAVRVIDRRKKT
jgi:phenylacetate-CoA ligase